MATHFGLHVPEATPEYVAAHAAYCAALGAFIDRFTEAERMLQLLLRRYAKVSDPIGRALFQAYRVDALKDTINRILDATENADAKSRLEPIFTQLGVINGVRNNLVHWGGFQLQDGDYLVSNAHSAHTVDRMRGHKINAQDMANMTEDLSVIAAAFLVERERAGAIGRVRFMTWEPDPWLYKPRPLPPLKKAQPPGRTPKPKRPPSSSPQ